MRIVTIYLATRFSHLKMFLLILPKTYKLVFSKILTRSQISMKLLLPNNRRIFSINSKKMKTTNSKMDQSLNCKEIPKERSIIYLNNSTLNHKQHFKIQRNKMIYWTYLILTEILLLNHRSSLFLICILMTLLKQLFLSHKSHKCNRTVEIGKQAHNTSFNSTQ